MGKQTRALNRTKAAAPAVAPSQTLSEEQMAELRAKHQRQQRFSGFIAKRPVPAYWQPVMQHLAVLNKVADARWSDDTLKTLNDDQLVHGLLTDNIVAYRARDLATGGLLIQYSVQQQYQPARWPIYPVGSQLQIELNKLRNLERMRPLLGPDILVKGRLNIPAYFAALEQIRQNDLAEQARREAARSSGDLGKLIAQKIAAGEAEAESVGTTISGFVQVETKKTEDVLIDANDPVATGLALERQAGVDATFEAAQQSAISIKASIEEGLKLSAE